MSVCGFFEASFTDSVEAVREHIVGLGFPGVQIEKLDWLIKDYLIDLRSYEIELPGYWGEQWMPNVIHVAEYLMDESSDGEVFYYQDLDLRDPRYRVEITPDLIRCCPPSLSGFDCAFVLRRSAVGRSQEINISDQAAFGAYEDYVDKLGDAKITADQKARFVNAMLTGETTD